MNTAQRTRTEVNKRGLLVGAGASLVAGVYLVGAAPRNAALFAIGLALGITLYHAAFGFTSAYRRAIREKDMSGVTAQAIMLAAAMLFFAPILAQGQAFGHGVAGALAPVSLSMAFGAFLFGIGMQLGSGCASGTLYTAGGGNTRMMVVLLFFCLGAFRGSLDLGWWQQLPGIGSVSLSERLGWEIALPLQLSVIGAVLLGLHLSGARNHQPLGWAGDFSWNRLVRGPWPLGIGALSLAVLNWLTLVIAGHAWSITWAFSLWGAKLATVFGWMSAPGGFWSAPFQQAALARPIWFDATSVMNVGILLGAFVAAALAGRRLVLFRGPALSLAAAAGGGLLMGYGARLSYGCNIGAFFSGVASTSLHGWVWILCAIPGNYLGIRLRPLFRLEAGAARDDPVSA